MSEYFTNVTRWLFMALGSLSLIGCAPSDTASVSSVNSRALELLAIVEKQNGCALPLTNAGTIFVSEGFPVAQERIDLIWKLRTQMGALSVFDNKLLANTEKCGRPPVSLHAREARFKAVQKFFLEQNCRVPVEQIARTFMHTGMSSYEMGTYLQVLLSAGAVDVRVRTY